MKESSVSTEAAEALARLREIDRLIKNLGP